MEGRTVPETLGYYQGLLNLYRGLAEDSEQAQASYEEKIREVEGTLECLRNLKNGQEKTVECDFEMGPQLYGRASFSTDGPVHLWLGADVMVQFEQEEAKAFLEDKLQIFQSRLAETVKRLDAMREQATITEVSMARLFNYAKKSNLI